MKGGRRVQIPTIATLRPCKGEIGAEADETGEYGRETLRMRYSALTRELPLAGAAAMRLTPSGELLVIAELRREAPWMENIISIVERQLEVQLALGRPWVQFPPMLLVGDPGCGKSWIARRIAELCGTGHGTADLAGSMDASLIAGNPRGWTHAQPVFPALVMNQCQTANPVLIVEEVDKAGGSERYGDPIAAMLNLLEPGNARAFYDKCLLTTIDVSHVSWVMTANAITPRLSRPFLSRVQIVEVMPPPVEMFDVLLANLKDALVRRWQLPIDIAPVLPPIVVETLRRDFSRRRSIRRLGQLVERVAGLCLPERSPN